MATLRPEAPGRTRRESTSPARVTTEPRPSGRRCRTTWTSCARPPRSVDRQACGPFATGAQTRRRGSRADLPAILVSPHGCRFSEQLVAFAALAVVSAFPFLAVVSAATGGIRRSTTSLPRRGSSNISRIRPQKSRASVCISRSLYVLECSRRCSVQIWSPKERRATTQRASCWVSPPTSSALVCVSTWRGLRPRVERPEQDAAAFPARLGRGAGHFAPERVSAFRLG